MNSELEKLRIDKSHKARRDVPRRWPWLLGVALLAGAGVAAWQYTASAAAIPVVETLRVQAAQTAPAGEVVLNATGYVMAAHKVELASKVVGRVAWVGVEMGDKVKAGQVLVRLEDDEYRARVAQQQGQLDAAKAHLAELEAGNRPQEIAAAEAQHQRAQIEADNAARNYQRLLRIRTTQTETEIEDAEAQMKALQAQADVANQQYLLMKAGSRQEEIAAQKATVAQQAGSLALAQDDLDNTIIKSPQNATVLERNVEVGEFVTNGFVGDRGAKGYVVSIADLSDLLVELDISQNDFAKVAMKQRCWITTDAYPDKKYEGVVQLISPVANRQKATVEVRVKVLQPDDLLKPDMNATVGFLGAPRTAADASSVPAPIVRIPRSAVRDGAVFVIENGKARKVSVATGITSAGGDVEITRGLAGGEELVVSPPDTLKEGDAVKAGS
ncbi:MAG TPA: efflux RND transporter periplasmic adaptor subunit [Phycisphaerae bacterium]|nr:efflux RND transporter periplasmic adaptor subunit [Phycisphaerae bacterium]